MNQMTTEQALEILARASELIVADKRTHVNVDMALKVLQAALASACGAK